MDSILRFFFGTAEKRSNRIADTIVRNDGNQKFNGNGKYFKDRSKGECDLSDVGNGLCTLNLTELAYADSGVVIFQNHFGNNVESDKSVILDIVGKNKRDINVNDVFMFTQTLFSQYYFLTPSFR